MGREEIGTHLGANKCWDCIAPQVSTSVQRESDVFPDHGMGQIIATPERYSTWVHTRVGSVGFVQGGVCMSAYAEESPVRTPFKLASEPAAWVGEVEIVRPYCELHALACSEWMCCIVEAALCSCGGG